jgi:regulator of sigma E protease
MAPLHILSAILGLSLLVILHEAGHYFAARAFGMRVERFSIGFGPTLVKYQPKGSPTVFQVCLIPFLAYVLVAGVNPEEEDPNDPGLYSNKSLGARILMNLGGPLANYITASVIIFFLALSGWRTEQPAAAMVIGAVEQGSPAASAGLRVGDTIVEGDGRPVHNISDLIEVTNARAGQPTKYLVERDGQRLPLSITPQKRGTRGVLGVSPRFDVAFEQKSPLEAAQLAVTVPGALTAANLMGIVELIQHRTTQGVMGPVGMAKLVVQQADLGIYAYVWILVMISVALGFFNLLPLPGLDGGKLLFLGYELITRRRANERVEAMVHTVGLLMLVGAIALVTLRDMAS